MATDDINQERPVNPMLGERPALGPIPGDQVIPWMIIAGIVAAIKLFTGIHWFHAGMMLAWGITTWWLLTGKRAWRFLSRFHRRPRWVRAGRYYTSPFLMGVDKESKKAKKVQ